MLSSFQSNKPVPDKEKPLIMKTYKTLIDMI